MQPYGVTSSEEDQREMMPQGKRIKKIRNRKRPRREGRNECDVRNFELSNGTINNLRQIEY